MLLLQFLQFLALARDGKNDESFVAIDRFEFLQTDSCEFEPKEAVPTTTSSTTTTLEPTPPPNKWFDCNFKEDLCGWELSEVINGDMFAWNRTNGKELNEHNLEGPSKDHTDEPEG